MRILLSNWWFFTGLIISLFICIYSFYRLDTVGGVIYLVTAIVFAMVFIHRMRYEHW